MEYIPFPATMDDGNRTSPSGMEVLVVPIPLEAHASPNGR